MRPFLFLISVKPQSAVAGLGSPPKSRAVMKGGELQILPGDSSLHPRVVVPFDVFEHGGLKNQVQHV